MEKIKKQNGKKTTENVGKNAPTKTTTKTVAKKHEGREFLAKLIEEGKFSRKELVEKYVENFKCPASTPGTMLSDGRNPKYNKFPALIIEKEDGKLSFGKDKK